MNEWPSMTCGRVVIFWMVHAAEFAAKFLFVVEVPFLFAGLLHHYTNSTQQRSRFMIGQLKIIMYESQPCVVSSSDFLNHSHYFVQQC